ncbi:hypothetical protein KY290_014963 [Solanum tuberosum]|uniref:Oligopeptide transporter n=1 Tax=Solanum tuberosum TaxID=4113 RepID=A0ABQ7VR38_SOLTU|nr:hypothetical protein KY290_014963 [Solanum tuberosum]
MSIHCNGGTAAKDDNSLVEQVSLTVPVTDDPTFSVATFRMWFLDTITCFLLSFLNQFFFYHRQPLSVSSIFAQIVVVPLRHLMAKCIKDRVFFNGSKWEFTLNPGPFNVKDHVLITIFANSGTGNPFAIHTVSVVKLFYKQKLNFWVALIVIITTQMLGFGWVGIFRRLPFSNAKFPFLAVFVVFFLCPRPTIGLRASWPWSRRHWTRLAKNLPIFSDGIFKENNQDYNISNIIDPNFHIDLEKYDHEGRLYLSIVILLTYGFSFACFTATVVHVFLFHRRDLCHLSKSSIQEKKMGVQTKLMRKYKQVPEWWFTLILLINIATTIPGLNVITEYIMGYLYPGYPVANMCFKVYGYISMKQGLTFLKDLKLGHYMKIPLGQCSWLKDLVRVPDPIVRTMLTLVKTTAENSTLQTCRSVARVCCCATES